MLTSAEMQDHLPFRMEMRYSCEIWSKGNSRHHTHLVHLSSCQCQRIKFHRNASHFKVVKSEDVMDPFDLDEVKDEIAPIQPLVTTDTTMFVRSEDTPDSVLLSSRVRQEPSHLKRTMSRATHRLCANMSNEHCLQIPVQNCKFVFLLLLTVFIDGFDFRRVQVNCS